MKNKPEVMPPFTLEKAAEELLWVMDIATNTRDLHSATHWILGNLLMYLDQQSIINGPDFISGLQKGFDLIEAANERLAAEVVCTELMQQMLASRLHSGDHAH